MSKQVPPSRESSVWSDVLGVLDKLSLKDSITRGFIFRPPKPSYTFTRKAQDDGPAKKYKFKPTEAMNLSEHEDVYIKPYKLYRERKGELHMVPVIMVGNKKKRSDFLMIYSHGNSCDLGTIYGSVINLSLTLNIDVLAYDYTGYGISPNKPSEKSTYKDLESVLSFAVGELNHPLDKIVLCGFSLGSGPTIEMATRFQSIPFIVLFAPLTSCLGVWTDGKGKGFNHDIYDNIGKMHKVWSDMLIIHGKDDQVVTSRHSQQLMKAYLSSHSTRQNRAWLLQISKADHENLLFGLEFAECSYRSSFISYFQRLTHKNHTNSVFMGAINDDKEKESAEDNRELIGPTTWNCYDGIDEESIKDMCNLIKRTSVEHDPESTDFESSEWNSSIILGDSPCDSVNPSFSGRFVKYETEHLKDLFTKISVNKVPEKWRTNQTAVFVAQETEALLFRKTLL